MSPAEALSSLNSQILQHGQEITFITIADGISFACRAFVRSDVVVLSGTELDRLGARAAVGEPLIPRRDDKLVVNGRRRNIEKVEPIVLDDVLIRVNLTTQSDIRPLR